MISELVNLTNQVGTSETLNEAFLLMKDLGLFNIIPSVLLTFAIIYGVLERINFPSDVRLRRVITLFMGISLFIFANALEFVVGYITDLFSLVFYLMTAYLGVLIIGGLLFGKKAREGPAWIPTISLLAIFAIGFYALKLQKFFGSEGEVAASILDPIISFLSKPEVQAMLLMLGFFIGILWWLSTPEKPKEEKKSMLDRLMEAVRKELEKEFGKK